MQRQGLFSYEDAYTAIMVPAFFCGIGSVWIEEGLSAYLGYELRVA
jgi:hypothetical protein